MKIRQRRIPQNNIKCPKNRKCSPTRLFFCRKAIFFINFLYKFLKTTFTILDFCFIITISLIECSWGKSVLLAERLHEIDIGKFVLHGCPSALMKGWIYQ